jgi:hypothetical protein
MDDADEREEGGEDLVDIMHVDGESSDKDESSDENDEPSDDDGEEDLVNIMQIDGESSDKDEASDEDDEASDEDDESSVEERLYRFEKMMRQVEENDPRLLSIDIGFDEGTPFYNVDWERFGAIIERNTHVKKNDS